jgi:hypothetical protein
MKTIAIILTGLAAGFRAGLVAAEAPPGAAPLSVATEVFDALSLIESSQNASYSGGDVQRIFRAIWWDVTFGKEEMALAKQLAGTGRPIAVAGADGRTLAFTKPPSPDAARQQRFLLPGQFSPNNSSYFVEAFRNTKDAGVFIGACRVHENAAAIMEAMLNDLINQARFQAKSGGEAVIVKLFADLEAGWRDANPAIHDEYADIVRRVLRRYESDPGALPAAVRKAAWLQPPGG